jgi:hypothetical protein
MGLEWRILDIYDPPKKATHKRGGLYNKMEVRRCSRGSNGIFIRDVILSEEGGKKTKADATTGESRSSLAPANGCI